MGDCPQPPLLLLTTGGAAALFSRWLETSCSSLASETVRQLSSGGERRRFYGNNLKIKAVKSESHARVIPIMPCAWGSRGKREAERDSSSRGGGGVIVCVSSGDAPPPAPPITRDSSHDLRHRTQHLCAAAHEWSRRHAFSAATQNTVCRSHSLTFQPLGFRRP